MASVLEFFESPSETFIKYCTKEQLLQIAEHYSIAVSDKKLKDEVKSAVLSALWKTGVLRKEECLSDVAMSESVLMSGLTFEQRKELLMLQLKEETERQVTLEKVRQQTEVKKLELQEYKLKLIRDGRISSDVSGNEQSFSSEVAQCSVNVGASLRLVPKFNEKDPDTFFNLF